MEEEKLILLVPKTPVMCKIFPVAGIHDEIL